MAKSVSKSRIKSAALEAGTPQSREEVAALIRRIGDVSRDFERRRAAMNDEIAAITARYQPDLEALDKEAQSMQQGVQTWCEANRDELTRGGRVKSANLVTGEVQWRQRPPSVRVRALEMVIETLERLGLGRFLRVKTEINKEAVLADPKAVEGIVGLVVVTGVVDFVIVPFEQEA